MVMTGLDKHSTHNLPPLHIMRRIASHTQKTRILGSAALDLCAVAEGHADGYFETGIFLWDVAAAGLIVREAGGRTELLEELPGGRLSFMASNGLVHTPLRDLVRGALRR